MSGKYKYFISFHWKKNRRSGFANADIVFEKPISDNYDICSIQDSLKEENGFDQVIVITWQPYEFESNFKDFGVPLVSGSD